MHGDQNKLKWRFNKLDLWIGLGMVVYVLFRMFSQSPSQQDAPT